MVTPARAFILAVLALDVLVARPAAFGIGFTGDGLLDTVNVHGDVSALHTAFARTVPIAVAT